MPDITDVSDKISKISGWLTDTVKKLDAAGVQKAVAMTAYDEAIALAEVKLRYLKGSKLFLLLKSLPAIENQVLLSEVESGGSIPATLIPKIAAGLCGKQNLDCETATVAYKAILVKIEVLQAQLNACQSQFRHLSHT